MKSLTVFCGSSVGNNNLYAQTAYELGSVLARNEIRVVYGGTKIGLMGKLADGALSNNGEVIGVLPGFLKEKELAHDQLTRLILVDSMHERKIRMHELSDAAVALPGGFGTMEEFFEMLTWGQLGLHKKPVGMLNVNGYYDSLNTLAEKMVSEGFLNKDNKEMLLICNSIDELLMKFGNYQPPDVQKWIDEKII